MFELATPWLLCLLPIPWLIWHLVPQMQRSLSVAVKIPFYQAVAGILNNEKRSLAKQTHNYLFFAVWVLLVFALSGPRWVGEPRPLAREGYNIMLALDISGSMEMNDMLFNGRPVTRLSLVKHAAKDFIQERVGDRIGLIVFGSRAYLQTPLTYDRRTVLKRVEDATAGLAGKLTSIGDALGLAIKRLQDVPAGGRVIVLLTDGVNNAGVMAPLKAAEIARTDGIKVYTIGLGSEGDPRLTGGMFQGLNPQADLDEATLKKVAKMTGGRYFRAMDSASLQTIYQTINQMEKVTSAQESIRPQHDYYPWPLGCALMLFLFWLANKGGLISGVITRMKKGDIRAC